MTRFHSMLMTLVLASAAFGCDATPVEPESGMVVLYATVDQHRSSGDTAALMAPLRRAADDPHSYTSLLAEASAEFGAAPSRVTVRDLSIVLDDQNWIVGFDDLFAGDLEVRFQPTGGGGSHLVATIPWEKVQRAGAAIVVNDATFDSDALPEADRAAILAGDFDVTVHGPAGAEFAARRGALEMTVPIVFQVHP
ncbi:MAG: hypothetical protein HY906_01325 [Deltaproteobacteria bacterium]|nr:hypothetical protein [Deltaproteobacteria bacterium]